MSDASPTRSPQLLTVAKDAPSVRMRIDRPSPDVTVLVVAGEIDNAEAEAVEAAAQQLLRGSSGTTVALDLSQVSYFGSLGLAMVARAEHTAAAVGVRLCGVTGPANRAVLRPLQIAGLDGIIDWFDTVDSAVDSANDGALDGAAGRAADGALDGVSATSDGPLDGSASA